jgi:hypothetical protein
MLMLVGAATVSAPALAGDAAAAASATAPSAKSKRRMTFLPLLLNTSPAVHQWLVADRAFA